MIAFLHWIISCLEVTLWQIGVVCAGAMGNLWIISLFTVMWRILYGFLLFKLQAFSIQWVLPSSVVELLFCWTHWLGKHDLDIWNLIPGCLMWTVWMEGNRRSFEDSEKSSVELTCLC